MIADKEGVPPDGQRLRFEGTARERSDVGTLQHQEDATLLLLEQTKKWYRTRQAQWKAFQYSCSQNIAQLGYQTICANSGQYPKIKVVVEGKSGFTSQVPATHTRY